LNLKSSTESKFIRASEDGNEIVCKREFLVTKGISYGAVRLIKTMRIV
jgi:hypothetical protein